ncbi:MAG: hypothetical protein IPN53_07820 [Comamonadaceae bacterium]|nr:hypothetical protein [Comamonadaceae bacterium]
MSLSFLLGIRMNIRDWGAFLFGVLLCVLVLTYGEIRKEPSGLLAMEASTTHPGMLKVLYTKDGALVDPGWVINFPQANTSQLASFPLNPGDYELIGFKPLVEPGGAVTVKNVKVISNARTSEISLAGFVAINQLTVNSTKPIESIFGPAAGANDPFGVIPGLHVVVSKAPFAFISFFWLVAGKLALIAVFVALMFGLSGSLPFATSMTNTPRPRAQQGKLDWLACGRPSHSLFAQCPFTVCTCALHGRRHLECWPD